jgi:hypothetical protein
MKSPSDKPKRAQDKSPESDPAVSYNDLAPEGSGVPVGTEYHWYVLAHQNVRKLNANDTPPRWRG